VGIACLASRGIATGLTLDAPKPAGASGKRGKWNTPGCLNLCAGGHSSNHTSGIEHGGDFPLCLVPTFASATNVILPRIIQTVDVASGVRSTSESATLRFRVVKDGDMRKPSLILHCATSSAMLPTRCPGASITLEA
jgi:hypothetical protein